MSTHDDRPGRGGYPSDPYGEDRTTAVPRSQFPGASQLSESSQPTRSSGAARHAGTSQLTRTTSAFSGADPTSHLAPDLDAGDDHDDEYGFADETVGATDNDLFDEPRRKPFGWNGGTDLGLLLLRVVVGGTFVAHGAQKLFGVLGGPGRGGFAKFLQGNGFHQTALLTWVTGGTELVGGGLLVLGLFTPLVAAGLAAVVVNAMVIKFAPGAVSRAWLENGGRGYGYELVLAAASAALALTGPGRAALDYGRSWFRHPLASGLICLVIAAGASAAILLGLR